MHHCAGSLVKEVEEGHYAVYAVNTTIERATLGLRWRDEAGFWEIADLMGPSNTPPGSRVEALVEAFVRAHHGYVIGHVPWRSDDRELRERLERLNRVGLR